MIEIVKEAINTSTKREVVNNSLTFEVGIDRLSHKYNEEGEFDGIVRIKAQSKSEKYEEKKMNIIALIDTSASMYESIEDLKLALSLISHHLTESQKFGLVVFNTYAETMIKLGTVDREKREEINSAISKIKAGGATDINRGFNEVFKMIESDPHKETMVFFLTDGDTIGVTGQQLFNNVKLKCQSFGNVYINGIGLGSDYKRENVEPLCTNFRAINNSEELSMAFSSLVQDALGCIAKSISVSFTLAQRNYATMVVRKSNGMRYERMTDDEVIMDLGDLSSGNQKTVIFSGVVNELDATTDNEPLLKVEVVYYDVVLEQEVKVSKTVYLSRYMTTIMSTGWFAEKISNEKCRVITADSMASATESILKENPQEAINDLIFTIRQVSTSLTGDGEIAKSYITKMNNRVNDIRGKIEEEKFKIIKRDTLLQDAHDDAVEMVQAHALNCGSVWGGCVRRPRY